MQITSYNNNSSSTNVISVAKNHNQQSIANNTSSLVANKTFNSSFNAYNMSKPGMINQMSVNSKLEKLIGGVKAPPTHRLF